MASLHLLIQEEKHNFSSASIFHYQKHHETIIYCVSAFVFYFVTLVLTSQIFQNSSPTPIIKLRYTFNTFTWHWQWGQSEFQQHIFYFIFRYNFDNITVFTVRSGISTQFVQSLHKCCHLTFSGIVEHKLSKSAVTNMDLYGIESMLYGFTRVLNTTLLLLSQPTSRGNKKIQKTSLLCHLSR